MITPDEWVRRLLALKKRGLSQDVVTLVHQSGNVALLEQLEAVTDADLVTLNERHAERAGGSASDVVHVITELGPTDGPGVLVPAELLGPHVNGHRIFYYDPFRGRTP